jgi:predicted naringenin-chalcone synthase
VIPRILGLGCATPIGIVTQEQALSAARRVSAPHGQERIVTALYRRTGIARRGTIVADAEGAQSFFQPASSPEERGPSTAARLALYRQGAPDLAVDAARRALESSGTRAAAITHLVTASCTGFDAPGVDAQLIERLGMSLAVQRTHIGFMGCHAAINALRVADAFCRADPAARVLVCCVELCTLHYSYAHDPDKVVANAIFADGAAAAVVGTGAPDSDPPRVLGTSSCIFPGSADAMTWSIGDHGFEMTLSARVPDLLQRHLRPWLSEWLGRHDLRPADIGSWAIHPGGPRVISTVAEALGLGEGATAASRGVLAEHGNMSSPTILFILERLVRWGSPWPRPCVAMAFGPGLAAEGLLLG